MTQKVGPPPYLRDIIWPDDKVGAKPPHKYGGGLTKRDLALFIESREFNWDVLSSMFKKIPYEPWRSLMISQMRFELGSGPTPKWLNIAKYYKVRLKAIYEEEPPPVIWEGDENYQKERKPSKRQLIDQKYDLILAKMRKELGK